MKKMSFLASLVVLCLPLAASAQDAAPKVEISGGFSLLRINAGADIGNGIVDESLNTYGYNVSFAGNFTRHVGFVSEASRYARSESFSDPILGNFSGDLEVSTLLFGPRVTLHRGKAEPFVHAMFGVARASAVVLAPGSVESGDGYAFAYALGGGLDVKVHKNLAIRVAQLDFLQARAGGESLNNFRFSVGVVIRLGNR